MGAISLLREKTVPQRRDLRAGERAVAILSPMSGSAGIWGPSCISCAQLAVAEVNAADGIGGARLVPVFLDSDDGKVAQLEREISSMIEENAIGAIVGMNVSSVRQRLNKVIGGRLPYVYTPLFEGNERAPNVYTIGETPADQLEPAIRQLACMLKVRRWALIGNDYVWPRSSHSVARKCIAKCSGEVVFEGYVPFGLQDAEWLVDRISKSRPDVVLVSLVGQDAVEFNRAFGNLDMQRKCFRLSTAIDENVLLATGEENTKRLFVASAYFASLETPANQEFRERYRAMHLASPPVLNALGQSLYEGIHFYAAMIAAAQEDAPTGPVRYRSARKGIYYDNGHKDLPIYLSRADGHQFSVLRQLT